MDWKKERAQKKKKWGKEFDLFMVEVEVWLGWV